MNRSKKTIMVVVILLVTLLIGSQAAQAAPPPPDYRPMDIGSRIRDIPATRDRVQPAPAGLLDSAAASAAAAATADSCILDAKFFLALDDYYGGYFFALFYLYAQGDDAQIWVQADLSFPASRNLPTPVVTCDQAQYMLGEFENNIYPTEVSFFGAPDYHDGSGSLLEAWGYVPPGYYDDTNGRQVILVSNVRDDNYYTDFPLYIAGFYSSSLEAYFDRNTMTIDAFDWENRTGTGGNRPHLYEGVFAHEYQHLLHSDYDSAEENWINEGLADWAEWLTGYGIPSGHVNAFARQPENSLVVWGDQGGLEILTDYGMAYMYQEYMYQLYGADFIKAEFSSTAQGIASVDSVLASLGISSSFAESFHAFSVATYTKGAFNLPALSDFQVDLGPAGNPNPDAFATTGAPPWGTDYIILEGYEQIANMRFNGFAFNPMAWTSDGAALFSGGGDLVDNFMITSADLSGVTGATLTFDTLFDIEYAWDYGFVQVSTDGGSSWTSLSNGDTCTDLDPNAHPKVAANVPGFTGVSGFGCNDPYAGAYPTATWMSTSFDLSAYDGQQILVAFRYVTDWAYNEAGWYVDNVNIAGVFSSDGSSTAGFVSLNEALGISNNYTVTLIGERTRAGAPEYESLVIMSGGFISDWASIRNLFDNYSKVVMLVTFDADQGVSVYAEYDYEIDHRGGVHIK